MTTVAVVGTGAMGRNHARVYQAMPDVELVAVVDADQALAADVARLHGGRAYDGLEEMLARERPEAVSVAVPTQSHFVVASALLRAGCHVLVEKPIAATVDEALELAAIANTERRVLMVGHIERFNPAIIELKRRLAAGDLGRTFEIRARRIGPFPERIRDVGVVVDLATHDLDVMRYLTGSDPVRVYAETKREIHTSREDLFSGLVRFADDTLGVMEINWLTPTKVRELSVTGERGMFHADYLTQDLYFFQNAELDGSQWTTMSMLRGVSEGAMTRFAIVKKEPLLAEIEGFIAAVEGDCRTLVEARDGLAALEIALALVESAQANRVMEMGKR
jgi:UDP-N-acetylglucosamine 3-dehydrogenase